METERKLDVLADIARALNQSGVTWAVGGSLLLYFKEIGLDFGLGDIPLDVQIMQHTGCIELQIIVMGGVNQWALGRRLYHHLAVYLHIHQMLLHGSRLYL